MLLDTQKQILKLYQEGKTIREIADILKISHHCVKSILCVVFKKLASKELEGIMQIWRF